MEGEVGTGDGSLIVEHYKRTKEQDKAVGVVPPADNATDSVIVEASGGTIWTTPWEVSEEEGCGFLYSCLQLRFCPKIK